MRAIYFGDDPLKIQSYLTQRLDTNGVRDLIEMSDASISPSIYANLHMCLGTSAEVELSFSILKRIFRKDRPFKAESVDIYLMFAFNSDF